VKSTATPRFRRYRCTICDRVVPWAWIARHWAILRVDHLGRVSVRCAEHEPVVTDVDDGDYIAARIAARDDVPAGPFE
jgi:hypothetical protein